MNNNDIKEMLSKVDCRSSRQPIDVLGDCLRVAENLGMTVAERVDDKPWGSMVRFDYKDADVFVKSLFPGLDISEMTGGREDVKLSPKFLVAKPGSRLSWQYHNRRAEHWMFLTEGKYMRSSDDIQSEPVKASGGEMVQFESFERHRLIGAMDSFTIVAEIWQHTDPENPSDEDDIIRLADDYRR